MGFALAGQFGLGLFGGALILLSHSVVLALEYAIQWAVNRRDQSPNANASELVRAWLTEALLAPLVFCWWQPFRSKEVPDRAPPSLTKRSGVLLVHGFLCNRGLWRPWLWRLQKRRTPFVAVNLEPVFGSIDSYAEIIHAAALRLEYATGLPPVVVAHSMGGLAVRSWLDQYAADDHFDRVITIGTPHAGTWLARFSFSRNGREMRLGSEWFDRLTARETAARYQRFTCFYSSCDNVVFPASTATLPGADNRHVPGRAHIDLIFHPEVFNEVLRSLGEASEAD